MECADIAAFTFATWENGIVLITKFVFAEHTVVNLFWILRVSAVGLGHLSKFFGCFIQANSEIWRKIKYLPG